VEETRYFLKLISGSIESASAQQQNSSYSKAALSEFGPCYDMKGAAKSVRQGLSLGSLSSFRAVDQASIRILLSIKE